MAADKSQLDNTVEVVTAENIEFRYRVAGPFRRFVAFLLDLMLKLVALVLVSIAVGFAASLLGAGGVAPAAILITFFGLSWFYGGLFETYWNGQTPGKWAMGIRVLSVTGRPINAMQAILRTLFREVDIMPLLSLGMFLDEGAPVFMIPTFLCGLLAMTLNRRFRRLGDLVGGTMVVIDEPSWLTGVAQLEDPRVPALAQLIPANFDFSRSLAQALALYVDRRRFFSEARRREIAHHLATPLLRVFGLAADTSHDLLLCAMYYRAFVADRGDTARTSRGESPFGLQGMTAASARAIVAPLASSNLVSEAPR